MAHACTWRVAVAAIAGAAASALAQSPGDDAAAPSAPVRAEAEVQPGFDPPAVAKAKRARPASVVAVVLDPLLPDAAAKSLRPTDNLGVPQQIGIGRPVIALEDASAAAANLEWEPLPEGGWIAAVSVTSPEAMAMRLGIRAESLPDGSLLRFYGANESHVHEVAIDEIRSTVARNLAAGEAPDVAAVFWSPIVDDATLVMEVALPPGPRRRRR